MTLSTVNCATSCVPSFVFTIIFGCPCKPLRYSLGPNLSRSSNLNSTCQSVTSMSHSAFFRRYGHRIVALAHPLCGQLHLTSPRISAPAPIDLHHVALIYRALQTTYEVIDLSSVCFSEHLAECQVIHVLVRGRDLVGREGR